MKFPSEYLESTQAFLSGYFEAADHARRSIDPSAFDDACSLLENTYKARKTVFVCGNGGSTAIANHMVCDHGKLIATDTNLRPKVVSLSHPTEMITAIANDISYDQVFSYQLNLMGDEGDVLIVISGSGSSPNVVAAIEVAKEKGMPAIAMTAFSGGMCRELADISLHVDIENYGVAEDLHQSLMQMMAQYIRMKNMDKGLVSTSKF